MIRPLICFLLSLLLILGFLASYHLFLALFVAKSSGDVLYLVSIYNDLFVDHYSMSGWDIIPAPYFFPDMAMFFPLLWATSDIGYGFASYSILFFLLFLVSLTTVATNFNKDIFRCFICIISAALLLVALGQDRNYTGLLFYFFFPNFHAGALLVGFLLIAISLHVLQKGFSFISAAVFFLLSSLTILSDSLILPQFLLPIVITMLAFYFLRFVPLRTFLVTAGLTVAAKLGASAYSRALSLMNIFDIPGYYGLFSSDMKVLLDSLASLIDDMNYYIKANTIFLVLFAAWLIISMVLLVRNWHHLSPADRGSDPKGQSITLILFLIIFSFISVIATLAGPIALNMTADIGCIRYMQPLFILPLFLIAILLAAYKDERAFLLKIAVSAVVLYSLYVIAPRAITIDMGTLRLPYPKAMQMVDKLATKHDLRYGYSYYHWYARFATILSRCGLRVNRVNQDWSVWRLGTNLAWYSNDPTKVGGSYPTYKFILFMPLFKAEIEKKFGRPAIEEYSGGMEIYVYNREDDVAFRNFLRLPTLIALGREIPSSVVSPECLRHYMPNDTPWNAPGTVIIQEDGEVSVLFDPPAVGEVIEIAADGNDEYEIHFFIDESPMGSLLVPVMSAPNIQIRYLLLPRSIRRKPLDKLVVRPVQGDGNYSIGHIFLYEDSH